jgi:hypothetical protein
MANHNEMSGKVDNKRLIIKEEIKLKIHKLNAQSASPVTIYVTKKIKAAVVMTSASYSEVLPSNISMYASCYDQLFFFWCSQIPPEKCQDKSSPEISQENHPLFTPNPSSTII